MLDPIVLAAIVALVKIVIDTYFPQFPVSAELINAVIVFLIGLFVREGIKTAFPAQTAALKERGLLPKE